MVLPKSLQRRKQRQKASERISKQTSNSKRNRASSSSKLAHCTDTSEDRFENLIVDELVPKVNSLRNPDFPIREEALTNVFQFRTIPDLQTTCNALNEQRTLLVAEEMEKVREDVFQDMKSHLYALDPNSFTVCSGCGREFKSDTLRFPGRNVLERFLNVLQHMTFTVSPIEHVPNIKERFVAERSQFCRSCYNQLKRGRSPQGALSRGWAFLDPIPDPLKSLSPHETLLVSLRLPCIYTWRLQGGFGQFASKGAPVSFSNPVAELASKLPRRPSTTFSVLLENKSTVKIDTARIRSALSWLISNNYLYKEVELDEDAFDDIERLSVSAVQRDQSEDCGNKSQQTSVKEIGKGTEDLQKEQALRRQEELGSQGPLDADALWRLEMETTLGVEDITTHESTKELIQHMLRPFTHRRNHIIPSTDAELHLESYFPKLFPFGRGGPSTTSLKLGCWVKHALMVYNSRFSADLNFIFFVHSVLRRRRLTGLSARASISFKCNNALTDIRRLLDADLDSETISKRVDALIRSGSLNASFETLRGSPAFWASLKRTSWAYLTHFGACQLFITVSAADLIDPYVYMQIRKDMTLDEARRLGSKERANLLANNPVAATVVFHRRVQSIFDNFLFGKTSPFSDIRAFLGRIEQQARQSPHLHLLLWLERRGPETVDASQDSSTRVAQFIELFCTAVLPSEMTSVSDLREPVQSFPIPRLSQKATAESSSGLIPAPNLSGEERQNVLSAPLDPRAFSGDPTSTKLLQMQIIATQKHSCNSYCRDRDGSCRFFFPFPPQERASIALRSNTPDAGKIALAPRNASDINSTHPLLTAMCRANTDVTVITGSSIAESMYVCNYTSKADKHVLFDKRALDKLRNLKDGINDNRRLLGVIARSSSSVRTIGGQEAVDNLVGHPLTFLSAEVKHISVQFLLLTPGALTPGQEQDLRYGLEKQSEQVVDLLPQLDLDENACVPSSVSKPSSLDKTETNGTNHRRIPFIDSFLRDYMNRPACLNSLSASEFFEKYTVKTVQKNKTHDESMRLLRKESSEKDKIASKRPKTTNRPPTTHILSVTHRGIADPDAPYFAAAALCLHVPFRSVSDLLKGTVLTSRLADAISTEKEQGIHDTPLQNYVKRSHELSQGICQAFSYSDRDHNVETVESNPEEGLVQSNDDLDEEEMLDMIEDTPEPDLPSFFSRLKENDPFKINLEWKHSERRHSCHQYQFNLFQSYINDCKTIGIHAANRQVSINLDMNDHEITNVLSGEIESTSSIDLFQIKDIKESLFLSCKTEEQKQWLQASISYLQVFYGTDYQEIPKQLQTICARNPPLFTNAPGGCGKSWLISKLKLFVNQCMRGNSRYMWNSSYLNQGGFQADCDGGVTVFQAEPSKTRFGKFLILAPTGVAASNCNGFTFHNALRTPLITIKELMKDINPATLAKLVDDFVNVVCIVVDEYSMASLVLLAYLDKVLRSVRPSCCDICFGGIPVIITGDGLQLPVVGGLGLLTRSHIPSVLETIHNHCTEGVLYLSLSRSVRQGGDQGFVEVLSRLRTFDCTNSDATKLNQRFFTDTEALLQESTQWGSAPILTARNRTAGSFNRRCIAANGEKRGTFVVHSVPRLSRSHTKEKRLEMCEKYYAWDFDDAYKDNRKASSSSFKPLPKLVLYQGMPVMLRVNICPVVGLSNGSIGTVQSIVQHGLAKRIPPHETTESLLRRIGDLGSVADMPSVLVHFGTNYKGKIGSVCAIGEQAAAIEEARGTILLEPMNFNGARGLPLTPAHSFSKHKSQGLTLQYVIIDPRETFSAGALYVAFSRAPALDRIALIAPVTKELLNKHKEQTELKQQVLNEIEANSQPIQGFIDYISAKEAKATSSYIVEDIDY